MGKRRLLTLMVILGFLLSPFSGSQSILEASAETAGPPTLSSESFQTPEASVTITPTTLVPIQATHDYIPPEGDLPSRELGESGSQQVPQNGGESDSDQGVEINASGIVLYDNGPLVTHLGAGYNGADVSVLQTSLLLNSAGIPSNFPNKRVADDFTVSAPEGWQVENLTFYAYQYDTSANPPISTMTGVYLQIWNGYPSVPGSAVIFGDMITNRMISTSWTGIYRVLDTDMTNRMRPIMKIEAQVGKKLSAGTYWLDWTLTGSLTNGPSTPPISILGQITTGNSLETFDAGVTWQAIVDSSETLTPQPPQGLPFVIRGSLGGWLWDQPLSSVDTNAFVNQEFTDYPTSSSYLADDFIVQNTWMVQSIFIPGRGWNGFTSLMNATQLNWRLYPDIGGIPGGDPSGGGMPPIWSLSLPPTDGKVTIGNGSDGLPSDTLLSLPSPIYIPPGHYWLVFYPTLAYSPFGQFGRQQADSINGYIGQFINPGGSFGYGTNWQDWSVVPNVAHHDIAFSIGGKIVGNWKSIAPINSTGRSRPAAATVNGKIYLMGGEITGSGRAKTVESYDPQTNTWTTQSGLMQMPASNICAAAIGTDIYVPGGYDAGSAFLNTLQVYHTGTDTWTTITTDPLPLPLYGAGCAALNGKLYVFGGLTTGNVVQNGAYVYNPVATAGSRWATLSAMYTPRQYAAGAAVGGKIYVIGGINSSIQDLSNVEVFDPADGMWHIVTNMNVARGGASAYGVGESLFVCGGGWSVYYRTCEVYDTTKGLGGSWEDGPSLMLQGRRTFAFATIGPVLYAIAGWNGSYLTTAERWSFDTYLPTIMK